MLIHGVDKPEDTTACRINKNRDRIAVEVPSGRGSLFPGDSSLFHFAKRRPSLSSREEMYGRNSTDESISLTDLPGPSAPQAVSATSVPPEGDTPSSTPSEVPAAGDFAAYWVISLFELIMKVILNLETVLPDN